MTITPWFALLQTVWGLLFFARLKQYSMDRSRRHEPTADHPDLPGRQVSDHVFPTLDTEGDRVHSLSELGFVGGAS